MGGWGLGLGFRGIGMGGVVMGRDELEFEVLGLATVGNPITQNEDTVN